MHMDEVHCGNKGLEPVGGNYFNPGECNWWFQIDFLTLYCTVRLAVCDRCTEIDNSPTESNE